MSFFKRLFGSSNSKEPQNENSTNTPKTPDLLEDIFWNLAGETYDDIATFAKELKAYNADVNSNTNLNVDRIFNTATKIKVQCMFWGEDEDGEEDEFEEDLIVETDNKNGFTVADFLFQIHNQVCERMLEQDATFFEGLTVISQTSDMPYFDMDLGS